MLLGTLKETLVFRHVDDAVYYRYEIYKSERRGGYFVIIHLFKEMATQTHKTTGWEIVSPFVLLKSNYVPNARVECELHFNENFKIAVE